MVKQIILVCSYNMTIRPRPALTPQPAYTTLHNTWHIKCLLHSQKAFSSTENEAHRVQKKVKQQNINVMDFGKK